MLSSAPHAGPLAISLNQPGTLLHWSIFEVTVANLVLIAVMVVIFGAALLLPFPGRHNGLPAAAAGDAADSDGDAAVPGPAADDPDARMWTSRVRRRALRALPPGKLLPDRQPAYVASWIYVFGVGSLAALGVAIVSGFGLALGGPDWWHYNSVGHFFNSLHVWSVELFMALLVIHPLGQVLDGRLARPPAADLDYRRGRVRGLGHRVLHRLSVPAELRLAVDCHQR